VHDPSRRDGPTAVVGTGAAAVVLGGGRVTMVRLGTGLLAIAIVAALLGFTGVVGEAALAGSKWIFCVGLVLAGVSLLRGPRTVP
jgi:uncharacterized membrane protein YtjA (UPF0391 family)